MLSRRIASHGQFPAVDVLQSLSRVMPLVTSPAHRAVASKVRGLMATWSENEELIRLGAYRAGSNAGVDAAIARSEPIRRFCAQGVSEVTSMADTVAAMEAISNDSSTVAASAR